MILCDYNNITSAHQDSILHSIQAEVQHGHPHSLQVLPRLDSEGGRDRLSA